MNLEKKRKDVFYSNDDAIGINFAFGVVEAGDQTEVTLSERKFVF